MRLIDADALKDTLQRLAADNWSQRTLIMCSEALNSCIDFIDEMPTVDTINHDQCVLKQHSVHEIKPEDIKDTLADFITLLINDLIKKGEKNEIS